MRASLHRLDCRAYREEAVAKPPRRSRTSPSKTTRCLAPIETLRHGVLVTARRTARGTADPCSEQRGLRATCLPSQLKRSAISRRPGRSELPPPVTCATRAQRGTLPRRSRIALVDRAAVPRRPRAERTDPEQLR